MIDDLQPKIDKWWAGLTPEEHAEWWSEGDRITIFTLGDYIVVGVDIARKELHVTDSLGSHLTSMNHTPAPCPQLWWKLEAWLGDSFWKLTVPVFPKEKPKWRYDLQPIVIENDKGIVVDTKRPFSERYDRRHALLDACLAVQGGRDEQNRSYLYFSRRRAT